MKKIKIIIPHPHIEPTHIRHTAGILTISAGCVEVFSLVPHLGSVLFAIAGVLAIYEPNKEFHAHVDHHGEEV